MRTLIYGAGSIGNHLAHASRCLGHEVFICDVDEKALKRTVDDIYPSRYGKWDDAITVCRNDKLQEANFDLVFIGTPPDHHIKMAKEALRFNPKAIVIEKPLTVPNCPELEKFVNSAEKSDVRVFVGYDHAVSKSIYKVRELIENQAVGEVLTLDVEFREHWGGIFEAHPWLAGPQDTYLGFWQRGGGATGEHSHALHLYITIIDFLGDAISDVSSVLKLERGGQTDYDSISCMTITSNRGLVGRCIQDVVTVPPKKSIRIQGSRGYIEWSVNKELSADIVQLTSLNGNKDIFEFKKTRPDDFIEEIKHIKRVINGEEDKSPIDISSGMEVMKVISNVFASIKEGKAK